MRLTLTILGSGSSGGVPRIGGNWGKCDPANPKNRRRRCSMMVEKTDGSSTTRVLIDTSPDLREQMLSEGVGHIDGVLYTHEHADHTHGIDELRAFYLRARHKVPVWADETTGQMLVTRFGYCFYSSPGSDYPPILDLNRLVAGRIVKIAGAGGVIEALPFKVHHGNIDALGFCLGRTAYTPDLNGVPEESLAVLKDLDLWIVDALKRTPHPSHFSLSETLAWIERIKPRRAIVTNMHNDLDYETLRRELPAHVEPAYDGMRVDIKG
jgi:phosphoribosyl 1,2-cyclic phosphate phosphodiesterase